MLPAGGDRRWTRLVAGSHYDAWLIAWPPGAELGMHDHRGSTAAVQVVAGVLVEHHRNGDTGAIETRRLEPGRLVTLGPDHVHAVANVGAVEALSVHVYSPPLEPVQP
jgi:quercetin dioxygenase-like cupin family protein